MASRHVAGPWDLGYPREEEGQRMAGGPDWKTLGAEVRLLIHRCPTSARGDLDYVIQGKCFSSGRFPRQSPRIVSHTYLGLWTNLLVLQIVPWTSVSIKGHYGVGGGGWNPGNAVPGPYGYAELRSRRWELTLSGLPPGFLLSPSS